MADEIETPDVETPEAPDLEALQAELEKTRKALKETNREAAERRKKLEAYEKAESERQQAEMTELDRMRAEKDAADKRAEAAEARATQTLIRSAFIAEAAKQGATHPADVYALADTSGVEVGEDGTVAGVTEAVKALVDAGRIPLAGKAPAPKLDGGAGGVERPGANDTKLTPMELDLAKKLGISAEKYAQNKAALQAAQA